MDQKRALHDVLLKRAHRKCQSAVQGAQCAQESGNKKRRQIPQNRSLKTHINLQICRYPFFGLISKLEVKQNPSRSFRKV
jgi:hypothetical protein